jgi:hypothetical protein
MRNLNRVAYPPRSMSRFTGLLGGPCPGGAGGHAQDVHAAGLDLHREEHVQALRNTVSTCTTSHARIPDAREARNCRQVRDARRGAGVSPLRPGPAGRFPRRPGHDRRARVVAAQAPAAAPRDTRHPARLALAPDQEQVDLSDQVLAGHGARIIKTPVQSPRANSFAERYVRTLRRECLDHLLFYGERHLRQILAEYAQH